MKDATQTALAGYPGNYWILALSHFGDEVQHGP